MYTKLVQAVGLTATATLLITATLFYLFFYRRRQQRLLRSEWGPIKCIIVNEEGLDVLYMRKLEVGQFSRYRCVDPYCSPMMVESKKGLDLPVLEMPLLSQDDRHAKLDLNSNGGTKLPNEPPKDYIHVRARRGQATNSHSLAERSRREKISERMKILQDLVPGCNKVIGKARVLDEIICYIQSLQRQVEFLSMKLEGVNSRMTPMILDGFPASQDLAPPAFDPTGMLYGPPQQPREYT